MYVSIIGQSALSSTFQNGGVAHRYSLLGVFPGHAETGIEEQREGRISYDLELIMRYGTAW